MNIITRIAPFALSLLATASAFAAEGYVTANVYLRAGPDSSYPRVARLHEGTPVAIEGCVDEWAWCDISNGDDRGWIAGDYLREDYEGRRVLLRDYGVRIGIPIVSFEFGTYWGEHYRNRSWYGKRQHWSHVRPQHPVDMHAHGDRREDSHNYTHGDTRTDVRAGDQSRHAPVRMDEPTYRNGATNAVAQPQPALRPDRHSPRADEHASSGRIDSGHSGPVAAKPVAQAQPEQRVQPMQRPQPVQPVQRPQPVQAAQPRVVAEHTAPAARAPKSDGPAKAAHEHDKDGAKDNTDARHQDPQS